MDWETKLALDDIHDAMEAFERLSGLAVREAKHVGAWNGCKSLRQAIQQADTALFRLKVAVGKLVSEGPYARRRIS